MITTPIMQVKSLEKKFEVNKKRSFLAVNQVSLDLYQGQIYGLVGESGSGKTTLGRMILGLTKADSGEVIYQGHNLLDLNERQIRPYRKDLQMVFQDTLASLNPRKKIGKILEEGLIINKLGRRKERRNKVLQMLNTVGLEAEHYERYPHQLSGGQRQRVGLARALIMEPQMIICDEPVSALDVSIQAQILNLLIKLQKELKLTLLFISHDISVVRHISDRIGIMYQGSIVEEADTDQLFRNCVHPYTKTLLAAVPDLRGQKPVGSVKVREEIHPPMAKENLCKFYPRCSYASRLCKDTAPERKMLVPGHFITCHISRE